MRRSVQVELPLHRGTWGGRRRKPGPNPALRHRECERFAGRFPCHVTLKIQKGLPSLRTKRVVREIEQSLAPACERGSFRVVHYSIQADHGHFIVEANGREALGRGMKSLAARFARAVNRALGRRGAVLAERYHLRVLRSPRQVRNALAYVLLNARRHLAKRRGRAAVKGDALDPASSARWFDGWTGRRPDPRRPSIGRATSHVGTARRLAAARADFARRGSRAGVRGDDADSSRLLVPNLSP